MEKPYGACFDSCLAVKFHLLQIFFEKSCKNFFQYFDHNFFHRVFLLMKILQVCRGKKAVQNQTCLGRFSLGDFAHRSKKCAFFVIFRGKNGEKSQKLFKNCKISEANRVLKSLKPLCMLFIIVFMGRHPSHPLNSFFQLKFYNDCIL